MIRKSQMDSIVARGRQRNSINTEELKEMLPVGDLTLDELIDIVEALESAGVAVRVDPSLLIRSDQQAKAPANGSSSLSAEREPSRPSVAPLIRPPSRAIEKAKSTRAAESHSYRVPFTVHIVVGAALVLAVVVVGLLLLAWRPARFAASTAP